VPAVTAWPGLLDLVRARLDEHWPVARLASEAAVSPRGLHRRFREATGRSPGAWLATERLARARDLLEGTALFDEAVAEASGFGTAAVLRHHFRMDWAPARAPTATGSPAVRQACLRIHFPCSVIAGGGVTRSALWLPPALAASTTAVLFSTRACTVVNQKFLCLSVLFAFPRWRQQQTRSRRHI
jgi:Helix-turn-helix domain